MIEEIKKEIEPLLVLDDVLYCKDCGSRNIKKSYKPYKIAESIMKILDKYKKQENDESPYCEVCGTCGHIGCCGIRNFIKEHIEGKTNCKNEAYIIDEIISLCEYKDDVFKENEKLLNFKNAWEELKEYITKENIPIQGVEVLEQEDLIDKMEKLEQKYKVGD